MNQYAPKIIEWLSANWKKALIVGLSIGLLIVTVKIALGYAIVNVNIQAEPTMTDITIDASSDYGNKLVGQGGGLKLVPISTKSLIVGSRTNAKTQTKISFPWYRYTEVKVQLKYDKDAEIMPFRSTLSNACNTYETSKQRLLSYSCNNPKTLTSFDPDRGNQIVSRLLYPNQSAVPYQNGLLGISSRYGTDIVTPGPISYTDTNGKVEHLIGPDGLDDDPDLLSSKVVTNQQDPNDNRFMLVLKTGSVYLGSPKETSGGVRIVNYVHIPAPKNYNPNYQQTLCQFNSQTAYCYRGKAIVGNGAPASTKLAASSISSLSFDNDSQATLPISQADNLESFYLTNSGQIYGKAHKKLFHFTASDKSYQVSELAQNIDSATAGDDLYYIQKNSVFRVDQNDTAYQTFYVDKTKLSKLSIYGGRLFIFGNYIKTPSVTMAFAIKDEDNVNPGSRLIDAFPFDSNLVPEASTISLVGSTISVQLASPNAPVRPVLTQEINSDIQTRIMNELGKRRIDTSGVEIKISY